MATYAVDTYVPKFSDDNTSLQFYVRSTGQPYDGIVYGFTQELKIEIVNKEYAVSRANMSPANENEFHTGVVPNQFRFVGNDFIGSADLRDQKMFATYNYHLDVCPVTLQLDVTGIPKLIVRTSCAPGNCDGFHSDCCEGESNNS